MDCRLSLKNVVKNIEFIYKRATSEEPAQFQLSPNIADVEAVCGGAHDIMSVWITYQFAIPDEYNDELCHIQELFVSAMKKLRHDRRTKCQ